MENQYVQIYLTICALLGMYAKEKGKSFFLYFILSILVSPILMMYILMNAP